MRGIRSLLIGLVLRPLRRFYPRVGAVVSSWVGLLAHAAGCPTCSEGLKDVSFPTSPPELPKGASREQRQERLRIIAANVQQGLGQARLCTEGAVLAARAMRQVSTRAE